MPTATLKPVKRAAKGHNRFCGPAALSIIAGIDTAEAAAVIRHVSRKRSVQGTSNWEVLRSLALLGFKASSAAKVDPLNLKSNPTLAAWLKSDERDGKSLYLIAAGHHWQVVQGRRFCCGITKDRPHQVILLTLKILCGMPERHLIKNTFKLLNQMVPILRNLNKILSRGLTTHH